MKYKFFLVCSIALIGFAGIHQTVSSTINAPLLFLSDTAAIASRLLTLADAAAIIGEPVRLTNNTFVKKKDTLEYKCDYTALSQDAKTGKTGQLYFMYEIYSSVSAAGNAYTGIYKANSGHQGIEVVHGLGDEAYYHTDQTGFNFVLVRKNKKMIRLKLNKITSHSSATEFRNVTKRIVDKL